MSKPGFSAEEEAEAPTHTPGNLSSLCGWWRPQDELSLKGNSGDTSRSSGAWNQQGNITLPDEPWPSSWLFEQLALNQQQQSLHPTSSPQFYPSWSGFNLSPPCFPWDDGGTGAGAGGWDKALFLKVFSVK